MSNRRYFFTGDTHFSHKNVIKYCNRPFESAAEMNETIIENWNKVVTKSDIVYHLGDVAFEKDVEKRDKLLSRLNGEKHLIWGNHDKGLRSGWQKHFHSAADLRSITVPFQKDERLIYQHIVMCHYAMRVWDRAHYGTLQFFGHSHGTLTPSKNQLDIGVDNAFTLLGEYRPFSLEEAMSFAMSNVSLEDLQNDQHFQRIEQK